MKVNSIQGHLFVISGPSAVGKSTVAEKVLNLNKNINRVVTCTTRKIRENETDGIDYNFMSVDEFLKKESNNEFIEHSTVYGNHYGILFSSILEKIYAKNSVAVLVINWEGFLKIKKAIPEKVYGIFLLPPTMEELEIRMRNRHTESEKDMHNRITAAIEDIVHANAFDISIKNFTVNDTAKEILEFINSIRNS